MRFSRKYLKMKFFNNENFVYYLHFPPTRGVFVVSAVFEQWREKVRISGRIKNFQYKSDHWTYTSQHRYSQANVKPRFIICVSVFSNDSFCIGYLMLKSNLTDFYFFTFWFQFHFEGTFNFGLKKKLIGCCKIKFIIITLLQFFILCLRRILQEK